MLEGLILRTLDFPQRRTPVSTFTKGVSVYAIIYIDIERSVYHRNHLHDFMGTATTFKNQLVLRLQTAASADFY